MLKRLDCDMKSEGYRLWVVTPQKIRRNIYVSDENFISPHKRVLCKAMQLSHLSQTRAQVVDSYSNLVWGRDIYLAIIFSYKSTYYQVMITKEKHEIKINYLLKC